MGLPSMTLVLCMQQSQVLVLLLGVKAYTPTLLCDLAVAKVAEVH